jgi:hypothetical protein
VFLLYHNSAISHAYAFKSSFENEQENNMPVVIFTPTSPSLPLGWGALYEGNTTWSAKLQFAKVNKVDCMGPLSDYMQCNITGSMLCTGEKGKGSCKGNSGGKSNYQLMELCIGVYCY